MAAIWAMQEMRTVNLRDKRLDNRIAEVLSDFGERPTASIPAACGGYNEMTAAYRLFDNEKVTYAGVMEPHAEETIKRVAAEPIALFVQDTTEFDFTRPNSEMKGAGYLDSSESRRGMFVHLLEAFTAAQVPLGAVWSKEIIRDEPPEGKPAEEKTKQRQETPIEEKESMRWLEGLRETNRAAREVPNTRCVCIGDSESDIYEVLAEPREPNVDLLVRACQDRSIEQGGKSATNSAARTIFAAVLSTPLLFSNTLSVRGREAKVKCDKSRRQQPRKSRTADVEVRATTVELRPPRRPDRKLPATKMNLVLVKEADPPSDDVPIEWLLITTLPIETTEQVRIITQHYATRFQIEVLFRTVKSGCRVQERRFEHIDRMRPCLAVYLIVAWRTLMLCRLGQSFPDLDCETLFDASEWKPIWLAVTGEPLPQESPPLGKMLKFVAQLGGYVNRRGRKDPPGPQTVWLGLQRMHDLAWAWNTFGPGAATKNATTNL